MSAHRLSDDELQAPRGERARDDVLRLVRQRLSQGARIVRLSGRTRRAVDVGESGVVPAAKPSDSRG